MNAARLQLILRTAFLLCDLEGVRQPDAAVQLGLKPGTLTARLTRARQLLLERLADRGLAPALAAGGLAVGTATAAVPSSLIDRTMTLAAAGQSAPAAILQLVREVVPMTLNRTKLFAAAVLVAGGLSAGIGPMLFSKADAQPPAPGGGGAPPPGMGGGSGAGSTTGGGTGTSNNAAPPAGLGGGGAGSGLFPAGAAPQPPGGAASGPPGGAPGGLPGMSGMGGFGGGMMASRRSWEYKFVDLNSDDRDAFEKTVRQGGNDGWEFCSSERLRKGNDPVHLVLTFKRPVVVTGGFGGGKGGGGATGGFFPGGAGGPGGMPMGPAGGAFPGGPGGMGSSLMPGLPGGGSAGPMPGGAGPMGGASPAPGTPQLKAFPLKHIKPIDLAAALDKQFNVPGRTWRVTGDEGANQILVYADPTTMKDIEKLIAALDVPVGGNLKPGGGGAVPGGNRAGGGPSPGGSGASGGPPTGGLFGGPGPGKPGELPINVFTLKNARATDTAEVLSRVFARERLTITPDERTNSVIVRGDAETIDTVRMLITRLDAIEAPDPTPPKKK